MKERRRSPRYTVEDMQGALTFVREARIVNMSLTGVAIETSAPLRLGRRYSLAVHADSAPATPLQATVVWCQLRQQRSPAEDGAAVTYVAGLELDDVLGETAADVLAFLRSSAVIALRKRICGRFRLKVATPVSLQAVIEFDVKKISAHGMQILTDLSAERGSQFEMEVQLESGTLKTIGKVATIEQTSTVPALWLLGIEFGEMSEEHRQRLEEFMTACVG